MCGRVLSSILSAHFSWTTARHSVQRMHCCNIATRLPHCTHVLDWREKKGHFHAQTTHITTLHMHAYIHRHARADLFVFVGEKCVLCCGSRVGYTCGLQCGQDGMAALEPHVLQPQLLVRSSELCTRYQVEEG